MLALVLTAALGATPAPPAQTMAAAMPNAACTMHAGSDPMAGHSGPHHTAPARADQAH